MNEATEPLLSPVELMSLRPTQITVGMHEVDEKRSRWRQKAKDKAGEFLGHHMIPVVLGPKSKLYILDHHHLALALHLERVTHALPLVQADLSALEKDAFWYVMAHRNWMHVYDAQGRLCRYTDIPKSIEGLVDDPHRSLAGELRRLGGYAKDMTLFSEFLWADFLRRNLKTKATEANFGKALEEALSLAKGQKASYLPGWCGAQPSEG